MRALAPLLGALAVLAIGSAASAPARAQNVDDCMRASPARAVSLCRAVIDAGHANADVWTQLALSLDKAGDVEGAERAIADGLRRYPRDADLLELRERLATDLREDEQLDRALRRNDSAMARGRLKLECKVGKGQAGIEACRRYLEMTDVDGAEIRERLAGLELANAAEGVGRSVPAPVPTPVPVPPPVPPSQADAGNAPADGGPTAVGGKSASDVGPGAIPDPPATPAPTPAPDPALLARRARVTAIQRALDALGLPVGTADGIAGQRTLQALDRFETSTGRDIGRRLDERTLAALEDERVRLDEARDALAASRRAARDGRVDEARGLLAGAESSSALLEVPPSYRAELDAATDAARAAPPDTAERPPVAARTSGPTSVPDAADTAPAPDDPMAELLTRIGVLERELADARARSLRNAERVRDEVAKALARR